MEEGLYSLGNVVFVVYSEGDSVWLERKLGMEVKTSKGRRELE